MFPYISSRESKSNEETQRIVDVDSQDQWKNEQEVEDPGRCKHARTKKSFDHDFIDFLLENKPRSFKEAVNCTKDPLMKDAINSGVESILQNHI